MTELQDVYNKAIDFAATAHDAQKVPGRPYSYVVHLANVAMEVMAVVLKDHRYDQALAVQCALLHDVLEDTPVTAEQLEATFGARVRQGVHALTKNPKLPKAEQMEDSLRRILGQPLEVGMVKLSDRITNLQTPPSHWTTEKIHSYYLEAVLIHDRLGHLNPELAYRFQSRLEEYSRFVRAG